MIHWIQQNTFRISLKFFILFFEFFIRYKSKNKRAVPQLKQLSHHHNTNPQDSRRPSSSNHNLLIHWKIHHWPWKLRYDFLWKLHKKKKAQFQNASGREVTHWLFCKFSHLNLSLVVPFFVSAGHYLSKSFYRIQILFHREIDKKLLEPKLLGH